MAAPRGRQQRLFTGALFPEGLNAQLFAFATRHRLQSSVWVPQKAFEVALKPYGVFILPDAALCDVALAPGGGTREVTEFIGPDHVLVNAEQTSHQRLMENFREFLVSRLATPVASSARAEGLTPLPASLPHQIIRQRPPQKVTGTNATRAVSPGKEFFSAADQLMAAAERGFAGAQGDLTPTPPDDICQPDPLWDRLPPFQHPLALNGSLLLRAELPVRSNEQRRCYSNYWRRLHASGGQQPRFLYTGDTEYPGRYNPFSCVRYIPHNYTGRPFPMDIARLMRHRAVEYGYVSRMWLTKQQAEKLFGSELLAERADDFPTIYCNYHTGGLECLAYYCADQFARSAELFPSKHEIELASKGVWVDSAKIAAFPLLSQLQKKFDTETTQTGSERTGVDVAMHDASRHTKFCELTEPYNSIRLVGHTSEAREARHLELAHLGRALRRQCVLCNYPSPVFISHRNLVKLNLPLRSGEEGVMQSRCPVHLPFANAWTSGECWFNAAQLLEPAIGAELLVHWPRHFLSRQRLHGETAVQCCRVQVASRARATTLTTITSSRETVTAEVPPLFSEWVPQYAVQMAGWTIRPGASGVLYAPRAAQQAFHRYAVGSNVLFSIADVLLERETVEWMRWYTPVNEEGHPYLRGIRQLMTLRANERGYQSPVWVCIGCVSDSTPRVQLRQIASSPRAGVTPLDPESYPFARPPFVSFHNLLFANEVEVLSCKPQRIWKRDVVGEAAEASETELSRKKRKQELVNNGIGVSAESLIQRDEYTNHGEQHEAWASNGEDADHDGFESEPEELPYDELS